MKVQCVICDQPNDLDDDSPLAKKLRNRPIHTFMCQTCHDRIEAKTNARMATGNFRLYRYDKKKNDF
ncbi:MAG TPA: YlaI family protein [Bacillaceae bacterium]